ncbi:MAG: glycogen/starch synthase [Prevotella sp.]|nr:glycogen/starch synthase [Prevotella sp.]
MASRRHIPRYVFETSWEVCNKVGGIYTVLSTRARTLGARLGDNLVFIGPDCWHGQQCPYFIEDNELLRAWREQAAREGVLVRTGRWRVPGKPIALLVDFHAYFERKNEIYTRLWEDFRVDSLHAYGDYDESSMFAYAVAKAVESYYNYFRLDGERVVFHANEWMTGLAALYVRKHLPKVATVFTTHATSIGRSICGNHKPLYEYLHSYDGDQMAAELNMQSKHSVEKQTAHNVDCFTTVSDITAEECSVLLCKDCDKVLPNGFEDDFVRKGPAYDKQRRAARKRLLRVASCLTGKGFRSDAIILATSGRYEFANKGIDLFLSAVNRLRFDERLEREVVAFVEVPGWVKEPRQDLATRLLSTEKYYDALHYPQLTHWLHNQHEDLVMNTCEWLDMWNKPGDKVNIVFIPCYLTGDDGILNMPYYDALSAADLAVYPSYYEPWGYTPLEATAFSVPCITTDLAGFGLWVNSELGRSGILADGVEVIHRTDHNFNEVADRIRDVVIGFSRLDKNEVSRLRHNARMLSHKALWKEFITHYYDAYDIALRRAAERTRKKK